MMRGSTGFDDYEARRQLLEEWHNVAALELAANDYMTCRVNSVDLKNRLCNIETNCRDRLHVWLLRIVGASTAPTSMALPCRWRSRPQHQKRKGSKQARQGVKAVPASSSILHGRVPDRPRRAWTALARAVWVARSARVSESRFSRRFRPTARLPVGNCDFHIMFPFDCMLGQAARLIHLPSCPSFGCERTGRDE